jgi:hypothetical protein
MAARKANRETFRSDATPAVLGFEYQKLIALEYCLNAQPGDIIYIECFGDVSTTDTVVETKNHLTPCVMTDQSPDFWKTLRNFVQECDKISQYSKLLLHTTAAVKRDSIFADWNDASCHEKLKRIERFKKGANKSIQEYVDRIFSFTESYRESDLLDILSKLEIRCSQPNVFEKYEQLKQHKALSLVEEKYVGDLLCQLHGYIAKKAIDNHDQWKIIYADFLNDFRFFVKRFTSDKIPFPEISPDIVVTGDEKFRFIAELEKIALKHKVEEAVIDFLKTAKCKEKLIGWGGSITVAAINNYEEELFQRMVNKREMCCLSLPDFHCSEHEAVKKSQQLFFKCRDIEKLGIRGVQDIEIYYQYGSMHKIVEDGKFVWMLLEEAR